MRIAIVGAGAVGAYYGARLAQAGNDVALLARGNKLEAFRQAGIRVRTAAGEFAVPVRAESAPSSIGPVDLVIFAVKTYSKFLPYFGSSIPGYPDALQYARSIVEFYNSPKDWAYENLDDLVRDVETALDTGSAAKLGKIRAKVNFFSMSWHQDEGDANSQVLFDFAALMAGSRVSHDPVLDPSSNTREAYLRTWGWSDRVTTWYLYFRKINFPADPEIHGRWEWAGIYFGEKMQ